MAGVAGIAKFCSICYANVVLIHLDYNIVYLGRVDEAIDYVDSAPG